MEVDRRNGWRPWQPRYELFAPNISFAGIGLIVGIVVGTAQDGFWKAIGFACLGTLLGAFAGFRMGPGID